MLLDRLFYRLMAGALQAEPAARQSVHGNGASKDGHGSEEDGLCRRMTAERKGRRRAFGTAG
jgi:hypothetical protein